MKNTKKALSVVLALIMAFSVLALAGGSASAYDQDKRNHYILPPGDTLPQAAVFAVGETVYGKILNNNQSFYKFINTAVRDINFAVRSDRKLVFTVKSENSNDQFTIGTTRYNNYSFDVPVNSSDVITLKNVPAGTYIIQIDGTGTGGAKTEFSFSCYCAGLPEKLQATINYKEIEMVSGDTVALRITNLNIPYINYFWEALDDSTTTDIDESKVVTVNEDGVMTVAFPTNELQFNRTLKAKVRAVFYYAKDGNMLDPWTATCNVTLVPPNIYLDPYATSLELGYDANHTITATTNVKNGAIYWQSSDPSVASVSQQGLIHTYNKNGNVVLTVGIKFNGELTRVRREIKLSVKDTILVPVSISFDTKSVSVTPGWFDANPHCTITYSNGTTAKPDGKNIIFQSADPSIATVSDKGKITGVAKGETTVTAMSPDGSVQATIPVTSGSPLPDWLVLIVAPIKAIIQIGELLSNLFNK